MLCTSCIYASQGGGWARLHCVVSAAAASATTLLRIVACVRNRGQATTRRWRRRQRQCACCAKPGKMGAASPQAFQDAVPDGSECACLAHRRYASDQAGGNVHREAPEQPNQYRRNPAIPSSPLVTGNPLPVLSNFVHHNFVWYVCFYLFQF